MNYNEMNKSISRSKGMRILGIIFIVFGILTLVSFLSSYFDWKSKEKNYTLQYVYSDNGNLAYEKDKNIINVKTIYDINGNIISLNVPDKKTATMYCAINNENECIYFDLNDGSQIFILNPVLAIIIILLLIGLGVFLVIKKRTKIDEDGNEKTSLSSIYIFTLFFLVLGLFILYNQGTNIYKYLSLKNQNNVATATIYSEIYKIGSVDNYKPVSYFYVNDEKYLFINDIYINGNLEDNIGETFEIYYDKTNPLIAVKKENFIDIFQILIGIFLVAISFPIIFFKSFMEKRIDKNIENFENQEWKI